MTGECVISSRRGCWSSQVKLEINTDLMSAATFLYQTLAASVGSAAILWWKQSDGNHWPNMDKQGSADILLNNMANSALKLSSTCFSCIFFFLIPYFKFWISWIESHALLNTSSYYSTSDHFHSIIFHKFAFSTF